MIQINLLPDVKVEFVKARRLKRTIMAVCFLVSALVLAIFTLLFVSVTVVQKQHLNNLDQDINDYTSQLESTPDIAKILTIQNQLGALTNLHNDKPVASRIFTYIKQLAPAEASINTLTVNFDDQTMTITGKATSLAAVNKFTDTLKFSTFVVESDAESAKKPAFTAVTLKSFGLDGSVAGSDKAANYSIEFKYAPEIFSSAGNVKLTIPNQVTTRSETEKPSNVFEQPVEENGGTQ
jgi:Tfp pilus assembly protein PilN